MSYWTFFLTDILNNKIWWTENCHTKNFYSIAKTEKIYFPTATNVATFSICNSCCLFGRGKWKFVYLIKKSLLFDWSAVVFLLWAARESSQVCVVTVWTGKSRKYLKRKWHHKRKESEKPHTSHNKRLKRIWLKTAPDTRMLSLAVKCRTISGSVSSLYRAVSACMR